MSHTELLNKHVSYISEIFYTWYINMSNVLTETFGNDYFYVPYLLNYTWIRNWIVYWLRHIEASHWTSFI